MLPWLDIAGVVLPLAQAIGRWANYINQELYGVPTGSTFLGASRLIQARRVGEYSSLVEYPADTLFHPIFLYESLWNAAAFRRAIYFSIHVTRNRFLPGDIFPDLHHAVLGRALLAGVPAHRGCLYTWYDDQ